ncbi:Asparagine--tRNA ligase, cytoplasmic, partial [Bulinus truncatus]
ENLIIVLLRDGTGFIQALFRDYLCKTIASTLTEESSIAVYGVIKIVSNENIALENVNLLVDFSELIGASPAGGINIILKEAFLTQTSQWHLESFIPALGNVFSISQSYRAELSRTRRHLAEFTHIEAESPFISYDELLYKIEDLVCDTVDRILSSSWGHIVHELNPAFKKPKRPFKRLTYIDAIQWLKENGVFKDDGSSYEFGDDIPEDPERLLINSFNEPIFLCRFPGDLKTLDMQRCPDDRRLTESADLLMPSVGEIVGSSMRTWHQDELEEQIKSKGFHPQPFYWYIEQRKFGSCPHGGYGLGLERFLCWILNRYDISEVRAYPRFAGRCNP